MIKAYVVPEPGMTLTENELRRHCHKTLPSYKSPCNPIHGRFAAQSGRESHQDRTDLIRRKFAQKRIFSCV